MIHSSQTGCEYVIWMTVINDMKMYGIVKRLIYTVRFFIMRQASDMPMHDLRFIDCRSILTHVLKRRDIFLVVHSCMMQKSALH